MMANEHIPVTAERSRSGMLPLTILALFLSAALLFSVQPMFAKMVLPKLGGAPGVWSVAMVFFQAMLLAGYAYAFALVRFLSPRTGAFVHGAVLLLALVFLPLALAEGWGRPPNESQIPWLLGLFFVSLGLPFFAVSANAPLLQAWYARSGAPGAGDPYFLYGASNLGSFIALLGYPVVIEPYLRLGTQSWMWSAGYLLLALLIAVLAVWSTRSKAERVVEAPQSLAPSPAARLSWVVFAFVPSALLVATTAFITTDIASAPFLWVGPLALYLLTFVLVFRERQIPGPIWFSALLPGIVVIALLSLLGVLPASMPVALGIHLFTFFVATMVAHARLYAVRPAADRLTAFYLWMSFGGVLGGAFAGLAAPYLFSSIVEYPFLLIASVGLLVSFRTVTRTQLVAGGLILLTAVAFVAAAQWTGYKLPDDRQWQWQWAMVAIAIAALAFGRLPVIAASSLVLMVLVGPAIEPNPNANLQTRSFFGVLRVSDLQDGTRRVLWHGTTIHGAQRLENGAIPPGRPEPLTYYHRESPMADVLRVVRNTNGWRLSPVGIVGLGTGSLACYREEGERFEFFEIDTKVVDIARDPSRFTFLSECAPEAKIHVGDARLTLEDTPGGYEVLVIDAFSSDAIPVHLLTREAIELYFRKLGPNGVLVLHTSNRHLDLPPVVAALAADLGLVAWIRYDNQDAAQQAQGRARSTAVVLARKEEDLGSLPADGWQKLPHDATVLAWTDDYSNIIGSMIRKYR